MVHCRRICSSDAWFHNWLQRAAGLRLMRGPNRFQKTLRSREREHFPIRGALEPNGFAFRAVACFRQGAACIGLKRNAVGLGSAGQSGMRAPYTMTRYDSAGKAPAGLWSS